MADNQADNSQNLQQFQSLYLIWKKIEAHKYIYGIDTLQQQCEIVLSLLNEFCSICREFMKILLLYERIF